MKYFNLRCVSFIILTMPFSYIEANENVYSTTQLIGSNKPGKILLSPGQVYYNELPRYKSQVLTYSQIAKLINSDGNIQNGKKTISIQNESKKVDFSFVDNISIVVNISSVQDAPPNASGGHK